MPPTIFQHLCKEKIIKKRQEQTVFTGGAVGAGVGLAGASSGVIVCLVFCCSFFSASSLSRC